jgi:hypothetical protein
MVCSRLSKYLCVENVKRNMPLLCIRRVQFLTNLPRCEVMLPGVNEQSSFMPFLYPGTKCHTYAQNSIPRHKILYPGTKSHTQAQITYPGAKFHPRHETPLSGTKCHTQAQNSIPRNKIHYTHNETSYVSQKAISDFSAPGDKTNWARIRVTR